MGIITAAKSVVHIENGILLRLIITCRQQNVAVFVIPGCCGIILDIFFDRAVIHVVVPFAEILGNIVVGFHGVEIGEASVEVIIDFLAAHGGQIRF